MTTISQFLKALVAEAGEKFEFVLVGQKIVAYRTSRRANRSRKYTPMQALYAARNSRVRQQSHRLGVDLQLSRQNYWDLVYAFGGTCQNGGRSGSARRRWIRKLTMQFLKLDAGCSLPDDVASDPDRRSAALSVLRTGGNDD